jgi:ribosome-associated translation inhibitor RaiA
MRLRDTVTTGKKAARRPASPGRRRRPSKRAAAQRSSLPTTLPRPVKLTRDRTHAVPPPAHIRVLGVKMKKSDRDNIARKLGMKLGKFASSIERITVRLSDVNGPKGGRDQICQIKVVLSGLQSIVVEERASTLRNAIDRAMKSIAVAVRRSVQRRQLKTLHHRTSKTNDEREAIR